MDLREVEWGMDWVDLAQDSDNCRAVFECGNKHSVSINFREFLE
jgi:hypothetical protein